MSVWARCRRAVRLRLSQRTHAGDGAAPRMVRALRRRLSGLVVDRGRASSDGGRGPRQAVAARPLRAEPARPSPSRPASRPRARPAADRSSQPDPWCVGTACANVPLWIRALHGRCPRCGARTLFRGFVAFADAAPLAGSTSRSSTSATGRRSFLTLIIGALILRWRSGSSSRSSRRSGSTSCSGCR